MHYRILIEQDEDGVFISTCPALPGCISQGDTRAEAVENIKDAIEGIEPPAVRPASSQKAKPPRKPAVMNAVSP